MHEKDSAKAGKVALSTSSMQVKFKIWLPKQKALLLWSTWTKWLKNNCLLDQIRRWKTWLTWETATSWALTREKKSYLWQRLTWGTTSKSESNERTLLLQFKGSKKIPLFKVVHLSWKIRVEQKISWYINSLRSSRRRWGGWYLPDNKKRCR